MLGAQYVAYIHDEWIEQLWAKAGVISAKGCRDFNLLESAVSRPFHTIVGKDAYPTILEKGVALFHSLISNHPFHDGNKRTAVTTFNAFLLANGYYFFLPNDEAYALAKATASYRERGVTHDEVLSEIQNGLCDWVIPFSTLRAGCKTDSAFRKTYDTAKKSRLLIRGSPLKSLG
jgi:death on curing protein